MLLMHQGTACAHVCASPWDPNWYIQMEWASNTSHRIECMGMLWCGWVCVRVWVCIPLMWSNESEWWRWIRWLWCRCWCLRQNVWSVIIGKPDSVSSSISGPFFICTHKISLGKARKRSLNYLWFLLLGTKWNGGSNKQNPRLPTGKKQQRKCRWKICQKNRKRRCAFVEQTYSLKLPDGWIAIYQAWSNKILLHLPENINSSVENCAVHHQSHPSALRSYFRHAISLNKSKCNLKHFPNYWMVWHTLPDQLNSTFWNKPNSSWQLDNKNTICQMQNFCNISLQTTSNNKLQWMSDSNKSSPHIINNKHFTHNAFALKYLVRFIYRAHIINGFSPFSWFWFWIHSFHSHFHFPQFPDEFRHSFVRVQAAFSTQMQYDITECIEQQTLFDFWMCACVCTLRKMWKTSFMQFLFQHIIYVWCRKKLVNFLAKY